ncbi:MAG: hypothetical protein U9O98_01810, partial [Asgard group archaeon]|nr:hypothetical protein [Asgard group archaeon]
MVTLTADFYIISSLIFVEIIILLLYIFMYLKKQQRIFRPLIYSMLLFLAANSLIIIEIFYDIPSLEFFNALLAAAGLAPIVIFLEIFENGVPFTPRSAGSIIFILFIGATKGAKSLLGEQIGPFFSFIAPILFIIIGVFFNQTINKMKERVRFENQKKKLRKVKTG